MQSAEALVSDLVNYRTIAPEGDELGCAKFVSDYLRDLKIEDSEVSIREFGRNRANVVAEFGPKKVPGLILSGHMDVVAAGDEKLWHSDPFQAQVRADKLYGRGATDMKSGLSSMMTAIASLSKAQPLKRKLIFVATAGEETGFIGLRRLIKDSIISRDSAQYVIIGEPTALKPGRAHRGICRFNVTFVGRSAHAGTPELGVNAIKYASDFLQQLDEVRKELSESADTLLGPTTLTPTMINGGIGENVVPPSTTVVVDSRRLPVHSFEFVRSKIDSICSDLGIEYSIEAAVNELPLNTPEDNYLTRLTEDVAGERSFACAFGTEGSLYQGELGLPTIVLGPGSVAQCHIVDEYVELSQIKKAVSIYASLVQKICF